MPGRGIRAILAQKTFRVDSHAQGLRVSEFLQVRTASSVSFRNPKGHRASNNAKMVDFDKLILASSMMWSSLRESGNPRVTTVFQK
ncbi:hypothetical protein BGZ88_000920 [Linnemannia elongata]|nr:hypothetical protein BGZ88_000920 [Linnemannia elongata]